MAKQYDAKSIEVLSGLDPVRKRPGMYTDTSCPNHLIQEVLDNAVDEALAGHCSQIKINLFKDGFIEVSDDGRGMPTDVHPEHKVSGVELILCKLHAGAKFSGEDYNFSGGLHGVGVSVVNALSTNLSATIKRDGKIHQMSLGVDVQYLHVLEYLELLANVCLKGLPNLNLHHISIIETFTGSWTISSDFYHITWFYTKSQNCRIIYKN